MANNMMLQQDVTFSDDSFDFNPDQLADSRPQGGGQSTRGEDITPVPGYYTVKVVAGGVKTDRESGALIRDKQDRPVFSIQRIAVIEPAEMAGSVPLFQDIYTNGFQPKNWKTGETLPGPKTFPFMQALASIDDTLPTTDFNTNCHELANQLGAKPSMTVRLGYHATDVDYAKAQIASGVDKKAAYKAAELKPAAFRNPDGTWRQETMGPSGNLVKAKVRITEWVRSSDTTKTLGPLTPRG